MKKKIPKVGDRIWLKIPHNGFIAHIFKDGSIRARLDEISDGTIIERISADEFEVIK